MDPTLPNPHAQPPAVPDPAPAGEASPRDPGQVAADLRERVVSVLRTVYDPEIPVNIHEIGLIYKIDATPEGKVAVQMTLTSPACPVAQTLPAEVETKLKAIPGVSDAKVEVVWEPPWNPQMMSEAARLQLGFM